MVRHAGGQRSKESRAAPGLTPRPLLGVAFLLVLWTGVVAGVSLPLSGPPPTTESTTGNLVGVVVDDADGSPIESAQVHLLRGDGELVMVRFTDERGYFEIAPPEPGSYQLEARRLGYERTRSERIDWQGEAGAPVEIRMTSRPIELDAVEVEGRGSVLPQHQGTYTGLYHRREDARPVGRARVYVREDLEAADGRIVWQFVQDRQVPGMISRGMLAAPGGRTPPGVPRGCMPHVVWGGFGAPFEIAPEDRDYGHYLEIPIRDLEGIELYGSARDAPIGVRPMDGECGVIVLWPRRGDM